MRSLCGRWKVLFFFLLTRFGKANPPDQCMFADFGDPVFNFNVATNFVSPNDGYFLISDLAACGDAFLVYDNGVLLGSSGDPGCRCESCCFWVTFEQAFFASSFFNFVRFFEPFSVPGCPFDPTPGSCSYSLGCFFLAKNVVHNLEVQLLFGPWISSANPVGAAVRLYTATGRVSSDLRHLS